VQGVWGVYGKHVLQGWQVNNMVFGRCLLLGGQGQRAQQGPHTHLLVDTLQLWERRTDSLPDCSNQLLHCPYDCCCKLHCRLLLQCGCHFAGPCCCLGCALDADMDPSPTAARPLRGSPWQLRDDPGSLLTAAPQHRGRVC
jgi:hypothetical protein